MNVTMSGGIIGKVEYLSRVLTGVLAFYSNVPFERDKKVDLLTMNPKEMKRLEVMQRLAEKQTSQKKAAIELGISTRQVKRLWRAYRSERLPANLTQAQRDYFEAHTYRRVDRKGVLHTEWTA
jgi:6-phosphogluconate dehydrogenase